MLSNTNGQKRFCPGLPVSARVRLALLIFGAEEDFDKYSDRLLPGRWSVVRDWIVGMPVILWVR